MNDKNLDNDKINDENLDNDMINNEDKQDDKVLKKSFKNKMSVLIGGVILFFAIIGIIASSIFTVNIFIDIATSKSQKIEFEKFITPLVALDPPPFETIDKLDSKTILMAGTWGLIMQGDKSNYQIDEFGYMVVPQADIEAQCVKLFGTGLTFEHQTIGDTEFGAIYNSDIKSYIVSSNPQGSPYTPRVAKINKNKDIYELNVEYLSPSLFWQRDEVKFEQVPSKKSMTYVLKKTGINEYIITEVKENKK